MAAGVDAGRRGGELPVAFNAANEVAVRSFLDGTVTFGELTDAVLSTLEQFSPEPIGSLEDVWRVDARAREIAASDWRWAAGWEWGDRSTKKTRTGSPSALSKSIARAEKFAIAILCNRNTAHKLHREVWPTGFCRSRVQHFRDVGVIHHG